MNILLAFSSLIDAVNERIGRIIAWLVVIAVLVSAGAAAVRYGLGMGSNAWLELQWYLFSAIFLLGAGYTLKRNGHVRIDVLAARLTPRARAWIDLAGGLLFLMPLALMMLWLSWPMFMLSYISGEISADAGGLIRWPVKLLIPAGFALLALQGVSEIIKRAAFLRGLIRDPAQPSAASPDEAGHL
jgi:TRAP-type mannitol/chloroaromatic compound transport system permease small subunit